MKPTGWNRRDFLKTGVRAADSGLGEGEVTSGTIPYQKIEFTAA